jgi:hypothetical protein
MKFGTCGAHTKFVDEFNFDALLGGEVRNAYKILVENPVGKRPLGKHRRRWEDNIKMGLRVWGCGSDSYGSG